MSGARTVWRLNIPELLGLPDAGLDDMDTDTEGNIYVSDGINGRVYKFRADGQLLDSFFVARPDCIACGESSLNLAVASDASFYVADSEGGIVVRYTEAGEFAGQFSAPGILSLCCGPSGLVYVLANAEGAEQMQIFDQLGSPVTSFPAPRRYRAFLDPGFVNLDSDPEGNVYVSYGLPPYRIWKVKSDGSEIEMIGRLIDFPEDAVLIADIALDPGTGILWTLLAWKEFGQQVLDTFGSDGNFLGTVGIPQADNLYSVVCAAVNGDLYLLDTGGRPGGDLVRISVSL